MTEGEPMKPSLQLPLHWLAGGAGGAAGEGAVAQGGRALDAHRSTYGKAASVGRGAGGGA